MSAPGHCTHCWAGGDGCHIGSRDHGSAHSNWNDGHCPACAEAERIADWIDTHDVAVVNLPADAAVAVMQSILAARIRDGVG